MTAASRLLLLVIFSAAVALLAGCAPAGLRQPWGAGRLPWTLAFTDNTDKLHIAPGASLRPLFGQPLTEKGAAASPTGNHVAVVTASGQLWIVPLLMGQPVKLAEGPVAADFWPEVSPWSRDGRSLVYVSGGNLFHRRLTGRPRQLTATADAFTASLSPDGQTVAYGRKDEEEKDLGLWTVPVRGGTGRQLAESTGDIFRACCPHWSPDGQWIAFLQAYEGGGLGLAKADGTDTRVGIEAAWEPLLWLPDSSGVIFPKVVYGEAPDGLWRYTLSDNRTALLMHKGQDVTAALSPDGTRALVASCAPPREGLAALSLVETAALPAWQPDPEHLTVQGQSLHTYWSPANNLGVLSLLDGEKSRLLTSPDTVKNLGREADARRVAGWVHHRPTPQPTR